MWYRDPDELASASVSDLGLAKFRGAEPRVTGTMTVAGMATGTPGYMSPEQRQGHEVDERTDIFAVGAMALVVHEQTVMREQLAV